MVGGVVTIITQLLSPGANFLLLVPIVVAELILLSQFALTYAVSRPLAHDTVVVESSMACDVIVAVLDEPVSVVRATMLGVRAVQNRESTVIVDHRDRPEIASLAAEFDAVYVTGVHRGRSNLVNEALLCGTAPLVAFFDGDCVPLPHFAAATAGYFGDPGVGFVQSRVEPINRDSLEHLAPHRHASSLDHLVIGPARGARGAAIWQQSGSMVRRLALQGIGGLVDTVTGAATLTSIALNRDGWSGRFHGDVVCLCVAPNTVDAYLAVRGGESIARLRVLVRHRLSPVVSSRLTTSQRAAYLEDLSRPLGAVAYLLLFGALIASVVSGRVPVVAPSTTTSIATLVALGGVFVGHKMFARHSRSIGDRVRYGLRCLGVDVTALRGLVASRLRPTMIPPMAAESGGIKSIASLKLLCTCCLLLDFAVIARGVAERFAAGPLSPIKDAGRTTWLIGVSLAVMVAVLNVLGVIVLRRQMRVNFRLQVELAARIHGDVARVVDLTPYGVGAMSLLPMVVGDTVPMSLRVRTIRDANVEVWATGIVRFCIPVGHEWRSGIEISDISTSDRDRLIEYCSVVHPSRHVAGRDIEVVPEQMAFARSM